MQFQRIYVCMDKISYLYMKTTRNAHFTHDYLHSCAHTYSSRDEMSRMAKSSSDGCLMVHPPRIYVAGNSEAAPPDMVFDKPTTYAVCL
jgi:hypothetical protein